LCNNCKINTFLLEMINSVWIWNHFPTIFTGLHLHLDFLIKTQLYTTHLTSPAFVCKRKSISQDTASSTNNMFLINLSKKYVNRVKFNFFLIKVLNYAIYLRPCGVVCMKLRRYLRDYKSLFRFLFELKNTLLRDSEINCVTK